MNKLLGIIVGIVGVFIAGIAVIFYLTRGMVDTATAFLEAVDKQDLVAARAYLAEDFKAGTDEATLREFLLASTLAEYKEASWSSREISGGRGDLEGAVTTENGGVVPLSLTFVKENGGWRIYSIRKLSPGLQVASTPGVPPSAERVALIERSVRDFGVSVEQQSMEHFRSTVSQLWQRQVDVEELDEAFGVLYGQDADFSFLNAIDPIVEPVALDENGVLVMKGYFPTRPDRFQFEQKYIYEGVGWKLVGFSFEIRDAP